MKLTKIVCTIGLKTQQKEYLEKMVDAGMDVMRLNFSHGDHEEHYNRICTINNIMKEKDIKIGILLDNQGPEIRTKKMENDEDVILEKGQNFIITIDDVLGNKEKVSVTYKGIINDLKKGDIILLDDGLIKLFVEDIVGNDIKCIVQNKGELGAKKGVNLPGVSVNLPALSEKDIKDLKFGCENGVNFFAASFVRKKEDIFEIRKLLNENGGKDIKLICKIENQEGVDNFEEILENCDGIMVARGDLAVEIPIEEIPLIQKMIIQRCNEEGKIVITATQMLNSMITNPRPTRAEITDVANAIFDGTDAVMLSGETSKHNCMYPVETVQTMSNICKRIDLEMHGPDFDLEQTYRDKNIPANKDITEAIAKGVIEASKKLGAKLIICASYTGRTVRKIRKHFPSQPILVITPNENTVRQVSLIRGAYGVVVQEVNSYKQFYEGAKNIAIKKGFANEGDIVVLTAGGSIGAIGKTDMMKIAQF